VTLHDWLRDIRAAYEIASQAAEKVSIVAHSMGTMLALYLLQNKSIHKAVFTSPYVRVKKHHRLMKKMLLSPMFCKVFTLINPTVKKNSRTDLEQILESGRFVYTAVPTESIRSLWMLQDFIAPLISTDKEIHILVGSNDQTIEVDTVVEEFSRQNNCSVQRFAQSGHNLLEESEKEQVIQEILRILQAK
ncbi:MAG: alpha/beta hydrolase, partial [Ignavibacteriales bacterium]|nr:alpha/beta hydrolase [Ignavibacteriales bacterium]